MHACNGLHGHMWDFFGKINDTLFSMWLDYHSDHQSPGHIIKETPRCLARRLIIFIFFSQNQTPGQSSQLTKIIFEYWKTLCFLFWIRIKGNGIRHNKIFRRTSHWSLILNRGTERRSRLNGLFWWMNV